MKVSIKLSLGSLAVSTVLSLGLLWSHEMVWAQGVIPTGQTPTTLPAAAPPATPPKTAGDFPTVDPDTIPVKPVPGVVKLPPRPFAWKQLTFAMPASIKIYEGDSVNQEGQPVKAWYADVDYSDRKIIAKSLLTDGKMGREATSAMAKKVGAYVAVNGGYFDIKNTPSISFNTVVSGGKVLAKNQEGTKLGEEFVYMTRGVFGVRDNRSLDATWLAHVGDEMYSYPKPMTRGQGRKGPATKDTPAGGQLWAGITEAIGGGPMLVHNGEVDVTDMPEHFGKGHTFLRHPRTAIGNTANGHIIMLVSDGRKPDYSMGFTLPEMAQVMKDLGCKDALNLDGGGSSTFVVLGKPLNRMSDGRERNVTTAFAIVPAPQ